MPPHIVRYPPIQCNTRERCDQLQIPAAPQAWRAPEGPDNLPAAPMGGGRAWPGFEGKLHHTQRRKRRQCGGRRRVRRARAGFEIDHSEPQARVWRSRGQPDPKAPGTLAVPQATKQQGQGPEGQAAVPVGGGGAWPGFETTRRAKLAARTARGRAAAHGHTKQPGLARHTTQAPDPKAPEHQRCHKQQNSKARVPEGQAAVPVGGGRGLAGLRGDAPSEARGADGSRAGRRPRAHQAARPSKAHHTGGRARRRPEHQRRHKQRAPDTRKPRPADAGRGQPTQSGGKV